MQSRRLRTRNLCSSAGRNRIAQIAKLYAMLRKKLFSKRCHHTARKPDIFLIIQYTITPAGIVLFYIICYFRTNFFIGTILHGISVL